jgi:SM-20-related protein
MSVMDWLVLEDLFDPTEVVSRLREADSAAAGVYGGARAVDPRVRSAQALSVDDPLRERIAALLMDVRPRLGEHFGVALDRCEPPQFLRYLPGDFFVAHQDGNTPVMHDDTRHRRVSVVLFLNTGYQGGSLVLHGAYPDWEKRYVMPAHPGSLLAFRSETTHEVTPVTAGERYTIVSWYR